MMNQLKKHNCNGFTIIEALVGIGIVSIAALAILTLINYSFLAVKGAESVRNASGFTFQMKEMFWQQDICTANLKGTLLTLNVPVEFSEIKKINPDLSLSTETYFKLGDIQDNLQLKKMTITAKTKISDTAYLAEIQMSFKQMTQAMGSSEFNRKFPIVAQLDVNSKITICSGLEVQTLIAQDRICDVSSNHRAYFDGTKCASRYNFQCFGTTGTTASCQTGWQLQDVKDPFAVPGKQCDVGEGADAFVQSQTRTYVGLAGPIPGGPPPYILVPDLASQSCNCYWATSGLSGTWTCLACCEQLKPGNL